MARATRRGLGLLGVLVFALACGTPGGPRAVTQRIAETGTLRVAMAGDYPPFNARTRAGTLVGLDADLAAALAGILAVELELVEVPIGELLEAVKDGSVDLAISGLTMTPKRNLEVAFAGPYYLARKAMLAQPEKLAGADHVSDLRGRGLRIVAVAGGTSEKLVRRVLDGEDTAFLTDFRDAVAQVVDGRADVLVADDPIVRFALLRYPGSGLGMALSRFSAEPIGIAISPEDPLFVNLVENYLATLDELGVLDDLRRKWLEQDDWIQDIE